MSSQCSDPKKNLYVGKCIELPVLAKTMFTTPNDFVLAPADYASPTALKTALQAAMLAPINERIYLWPKFSSFENVDENAIYEDNVLGITPVRDGQYRKRFGISQSLCVHKAMFSHRARNNGRVLLFDLENQLFGTEDADGSGNIRGFNMALLHTEKLIISDGSVSTKSPLFLAMSDNEEIDRYGALIEASIVNTLIRLADVTIEVVDLAPTDSAIVVKVYITCDETPVTGLLVADFIAKKPDGNAITITSSTPDANIPGQYTLASATDFVTLMTLTLRAPSLLTVQAYEHPAPITVTIA